jgi:hypothetical protein
MSYKSFFSQNKTLLWNQTELNIDRYLNSTKVIMFVYYFLLAECPVCCSGSLSIIHSVHININIHIWNLFDLIVF